MLNTPPSPLSELPSNASHTAVQGVPIAGTVGFCPPCYIPTPTLEIYHVILTQLGLPPYFLKP